MFERAFLYIKSNGMSMHIESTSSLIIYNILTLCSLFNNITPLISPECAEHPNHCISINYIIHIKLCHRSSTVKVYLGEAQSINGNMDSILPHNL